jgi:hypothetical protein
MATRSLFAGEVPTYSFEALPASGADTFPLVYNAADNKVEFTTTGASSGVFNAEAGTLTFTGAGGGASPATSSVSSIIPVSGAELVTLLVNEVTAWSLTGTPATITAPLPEGIQGPGDATVVGSIHVTDSAGVKVCTVSVNNTTMTITPSAAFATGAMGANIPPFCLTWVHPL